MGLEYSVLSRCSFQSHSPVTAQVFQYSKKKGKEEKKKPHPKSTVRSLYVPYIPSDVQRYEGTLYKMEISEEKMKV